jgi:hypothetical protein
MPQQFADKYILALEQATKEKPSKRAGLKPPAQCMEALRADGRVGFNRLS